MMGVRKRSKGAKKVKVFFRYQQRRLSQFISHLKIKKMQNIVSEYTIDVEEPEVTIVRWTE